MTLSNLASLKSGLSYCAPPIIGGVVVIAGLSTAEFLGSKWQHGPLLFLSGACFTEGGRRLIKVSGLQKGVAEEDLCQKVAKYGATIFGAASMSLGVLLMSLGVA